MPSGSLTERDIHRQGLALRDGADDERRAGGVAGVRAVLIDVGDIDKDALFIDEAGRIGRLKLQRVKRRGLEIEHAVEQDLVAFKAEQASCIVGEGERIALALQRVVDRGLGNERSRRGIFSDRVEFDDPQRDVRRGAKLGSGEIAVGKAIDFDAVGRIGAVRAVRAKIPDGVGLVPGVNA